MRRKILIITLNCLLLLATAVNSSVSACEKIDEAYFKQGISYEELDRDDKVSYLKEKGDCIRNRMSKGTQELFKMQNAWNNLQEEWNKRGMLWGALERQRVQLVPYALSGNIDAEFNIGLITQKQQKLGLDVVKFKARFKALNDRIKNFHDGLFKDGNELRGIDEKWYKLMSMTKEEIELDTIQREVKKSEKSLADTKKLLESAEQLNAKTTKLLSELNL